MTNKNILVALDGSDHSLKALQFALDTAKDLREKIIILNVQPTYETFNTKRFVSQKDIDEYIKQQAEEVFNKARTIIEAGADYEMKFRSGIPEIQIFREADEQGVRFIVIGSRGLGSITGKILGSVSQGVIKNSSCPVTVVP
jgi:nucleotide-binding universal stress UspA family protein